MAEHASTPRAMAGLDAIERRFCFAAWPQAFAHGSWFDQLDARLGLAVSRDCSRAAGGAEQAVARALLMQAGTGLHQHGLHQQGLAIDDWPLWAMQTHAPMQRHLSTVGALNLLPELMSAVSGEMARQWDGVLGHGVRRAALLLGQTRPPSHQARESAPVRQYALQSARSAADWERFCLRLGLTAVVEHGSAVQARVRLAWPQGLQDAEPWPADAALRAWLDACLDSVAQLAGDASVREVAA